MKISDCVTILTVKALKFTKISETHKVQKMNSKP